MVNAPDFDSGIVGSIPTSLTNGHVAELAYATGLSPVGEIHEGSTPSMPTKFILEDGNMALYEIKRHGGNSNHEWRTVYTTNDPNIALNKFYNISSKMQKGTLILYENGVPKLKDDTCNRW